MLTRYQAKELGGRGISVNILAPGAIETDFGGGAVRDNANLNAMVASNTALGRAGYRTISVVRLPACWRQAATGSPGAHRGVGGMFL